MPTPLPITPDTAARAADCLHSGGLVVFPTETVYGLGANARDGEAVARIFEAKGRPRFNPLIVHVADLDDAKRLAHFSHEAEALAKAFWPGPMTLVLPRRKESGLSDLVCAGLPSVALRVPAHEGALALIRAADLPIAGPSANPSGRVSPTRADHAAADLGDKADMILDGGPCLAGLESTIVGLTDGEPALLRAGALGREAIEEALGRPLASPRRGALPQAPGMLSSHYAPRARLRLDVQSALAGEAFLGFGETDGGTVPGPRLNLSARGDLREAAANLFAHLRELDASGAAGIAVAPIPHDGLGEAINDRLRRAAAPRPQSDKQGTSDP